VLTGPAPGLVRGIGITARYRRPVILVRPERVTDVAGGFGSPARWSPLFGPMPDIRQHDLDVLRRR